MAEKDDKTFPNISVPSGLGTNNTLTVSGTTLVTTSDELARTNTIQTKPRDPVKGINIDGLSKQSSSGVITTQGITLAVLPSQPQQSQKFMIPKVSLQQPFTGVTPLTNVTVKHMASNPVVSTGVRPVGNLTVKSVSANQSTVANPLAMTIIKPGSGSPGTPTALPGAGATANQTSFVGKASIAQQPGNMTMTTIPNLQLAAATLQHPSTAGLQQSPNGNLQQLQLTANLHAAQAAQLGQFILIKTDPQGQPTLGMLQKSGIAQQLQGAQIIQGPLRLGTTKASSKGRQHATTATSDNPVLQAQQVALPPAHPLFTKDKIHGGKKSKSIKHIQIQPAMVRHPLPSPTAQIQHIKAQFQSNFQPPTSMSVQQQGTINQTQTSQTPSSSPTINPALLQGQSRPIQLPKVIYKQPPHGLVVSQPSSKLPATTLVSSTSSLQAVPIAAPTSNVVTTVASSFSQPIILNQGGVPQRFILQTAPNQQGAIRMPAAQPGKPPPLVPVAQVAGPRFKLVPTTKGFVPPVSITSATVAQQLAQARPRAAGPLGNQLKTGVSTSHPQTPVLTQTSSHPLNITQQLFQAGIRQPLPPGTQLHITSTSKGLQLQPIQTMTCTSVPTLVSPRMTVAQNLQLQAQAKLVPRNQATTSQQGATATSLQGKITTLGQLGALSNAHLISGSSIQVQGGLPQTGMIPAGQVTSQSNVGQQGLPIQATVIPTSLMSTQTTTGTTQIGMSLQKQPVVPGAGQFVMQQPWGPVVCQSKGSSIGSSGAMNQQALQARLVYQQSDGQGNVATSTVPANITLQAFQNSGSPQRSVHGTVGQATQPTSGPTQLQASPGQSLQTIVQPQLIQTCGAQATIGLIQVSISQPGQQPGTVNSVSTPMMRATLQAPIPSTQTGPPLSSPGSPVRPQLLQVSGLPGGQQQFIQVMAQMPTLLPSPMPTSGTLPITSVHNIQSTSAANQVVFPKLEDIELEETDPVSSIDLAIRYKMLYPQAPIPRRKRNHSETQDDSTSEDVKPKVVTGTETPSKSGGDQAETSKDVKVDDIGDGAHQANKEKAEVKPEIKQDQVKLPDKKDTSSSVPAKEVRSEDEAVEFTWDEYLELTGATPVPHDAFKHVEAGIRSIIKVGMKVEAPNQLSRYNPGTRTYWVATTVATSGNLLLLRYEGYGENRSADMWCELTKGDLHPIGWCARNGSTLQPPDALIGNNINWQEFLVNTLTGAKTIPEPYLTGKIKPVPIDRIKRGMRIELTDAEDPQFVWIAVIKENHGGRLRLRYAGIDDEKEDTWLHYLSWRVHPIGWAKANGATVSPPRSLRQRHHGASDAQWNTTHQYALSAAQRDPIPKDIFKDQPKIKPHQFKVGMKLEAINPRSPSQITPATVTKTFNDKYFVVTIDDCTAEKNGGISFVCHADCGGIFPVKWCKRNGVAITPPKGYEAVKFDWSSYLRQHGVKGAHSDSFRSTTDSEYHPFKPGFKLEAVNPYHPAQISVATITKVAGKHVWLHFDGSKLPNHIIDTNGYDIFPVGWCDTNGYPLRAPKKLLAKRRKIAIVWPEKHHHNCLMPMSPGHDLYQKVRGANRQEETSGEGVLGKLYFNHKCFSGPYLNKGRIAELPKAVGPGMVTLVIREVISLLVNAGYKPPRVLRELQVENEETAGMNGYLQIMKAKYKGKSFRALVEICKSAEEVYDYLRNMCIKLECCPNLVSQQYVETECPENCAMLTKTKYNCYYGKKKVSKLGRPLAPPVSQEDNAASKKIGGRRRKKRRPFVHRKKHNLLPGSGEGDGEQEENGEPMAEGGGETTSLSVVKHEKPAVTRARALVESAKRSKKIHHATPKLILPARERGTKMKTFAARLTSSRAQRKAEKLQEELAKKASLITAKAERDKKHKKTQEIERLHLDSNPLNWTVEEVVQFILKTDCASLANIFSEQEIDGQSLLLLTLPTVQECMDLKLGPAIKLCHHIERVKIAFYEQFAQ